MIIDGVICRKVGTYSDQPTNKNKFYGSVPLEWLLDLPPRSGAIKVVVILWAYSAMCCGKWFSVSNNIFKEYGVSAARKNEILLTLERAGKIKLKRAPGKAFQIKLVKPKGWK